MIGAYYDTVFNAAQGQGLSIEAAADHAATSFLDGKPSGLGKRKYSGTDRHAAFWSAHFLRALPAQAWQQESFSLALARYLGQDRVACPEIVVHVAMLAPDVLQQAARRAGLVLRQESPRWREIEALADSQAETFSELVQVFRIFKQAHQVPAVRHALLHDSSLRQALALPPEAEPAITAWIVDTSIEWDHQAFRGFLKISLEEIQIALRDDRRWLNDPEGLFRATGAGDATTRTDTGAKPIDTLYPDGFSARKFIEVVESAAVWTAAA